MLMTNIYHSNHLESMLPVIIRYGGHLVIGVSVFERLINAKCEIRKNNDCQNQVRK
jgi:hypothetical protein